MLLYIAQRDAASAIQAQSLRTQDKAGHSRANQALGLKQIFVTTDWRTVLASRTAQASP